MWARPYPLLLVLSRFSAFATTGYMGRQVASVKSQAAEKMIRVAKEGQPGRGMMPLDTLPTPVLELLLDAALCCEDMQHAHMPPSLFIESPLSFTLSEENVEWLTVRLFKTCYLGVAFVKLSGPSSQLVQLAPSDTKRVRVTQPGRYRLQSGRGAVSIVRHVNPLTLDWAMRVLR